MGPVGVRKVSSAGKYSLASYELDEGNMGGDNLRIDSTHYYVAFNSSGAGGGERQWRQYIRERMGISNYKVVKKRVRDTYPGFVAQQVEGIIEIPGNTQ